MPPIATMMRCAALQYSASTTTRKNSVKGDLNMSVVEIGPILDYEAFPAEVAIGHREYYLVRNQDHYRLFSRLCPHAGGTVDYEDGFFVCPMHDWSFHAEDGTCARFDTKLREIEVEIRDGSLYALLP